MDPLHKVASLEPTRKAFSRFEEFKDFAFKGNVILPSNQGYLGWKWVIDGKEVPYGLFLGEVVNFLIVSLALFLFIVKFLSWVTKAKKEEEAALLPLTKDQELLTEIRDLLKNGRA